MSKEVGAGGRFDIFLDSAGDVAQSYEIYHVSGQPHHNISHACDSHS